MPTEWHLLPTRSDEVTEGFQTWHPAVWQVCQRKDFPTLDALMGWLDPTAYQPASSLELPDLDVAVARIQSAIIRQERVAVWGDFDVDGQTSTALLVSALRALNVSVLSYIPNRMTEGHGVHLASLTRLIEQGIHLVITCDTGVDAHEAVELARLHGVDVIITDHHKLPNELPNALAVVNPRRLPPDHPLRDLPGVGVAYKLIEALLPDPTSYLDLVALGIVADVAVLRGDTRYLLQQGLQVLNTTTRLGLLTMMEYANIQLGKLDETTIAFQLAPRLNALGRLDDANSSTDLLTTHDLSTARRLANQLEALNLERRRLSDEVWESVNVLLEQQPGLLRHAALVLDHPKWHTGVMGIVANRCAEHYHKPTVLLNSGGEGIARGSARSVDGVDITDAIAMTESLLLGYGGHTMAAGVSLQTEQIDPFRRALSAQVRDQLGTATPETALMLDGTLTLDELTPLFFEQLFRLAPFGAGNPNPIWMVEAVQVVGTRAIGRQRKHLRVTVADQTGTQADVLWWNSASVLEGWFDLALQVMRSADGFQLQWVDARPSATSPHQHTSTREVIDYRHSLNETDPMLMSRAVIYTAHHALANAPLSSDATTLWVQFIPPTAQAWQALLEMKSIRTLILVGDQFITTRPSSLLQSLTQWMGQALRQASSVHVDMGELALQINVDALTLEKALTCLVSAGLVVIHPDDERGFTVKRGQSTNGKPSSASLQSLHAHLLERQAWLNYWQHTPADALTRVSSVLTRL